MGYPPSPYMERELFSKSRIFAHFADFSLFAKIWVCRVFTTSWKCEYFLCCRKYGCVKIRIFGEWDTKYRYVLAIFTISKKSTKQIYPHFGDMRKNTHFWGVGIFIISQKLWSSAKSATLVIAILRYNYIQSKMWKMWIEDECWYFFRRKNIEIYKLLTKL